LPVILTSAFMSLRTGIGDTGPDNGRAGAIFLGGWTGNQSNDKRNGYGNPDP